MVARVDPDSDRFASFVFGVDGTGLEASLGEELLVVLDFPVVSGHVSRAH